MFRLNALNIKRQQEKDSVIQAEEAKLLAHALEQERQAKQLEEAHTAQRAAVLDSYVFTHLFPGSQRSMYICFRIPSPAVPTCVQEAKRFQAFLKSRAAFKEEDETHLDQVLVEENEAAWRRREYVWEQDRLAKEALKAEVMEGMAQQVEQHHQDSLEAEAEVRRLHAHEKSLHRWVLIILVG